MLDAGEEIVVFYHTPQLLRAVLGAAGWHLHAGHGRRADHDHRSGIAEEIRRSAARHQSRAGEAEWRKVPVQFGEWRPDVALLDTQFASEVENVFAGVNSYLPFPSLLPFGVTPLADACGLYAARTSNGGWKIYGGTPTKLCTWSACRLG